MKKAVKQRNELQRKELQLTLGAKCERGRKLFTTRTATTRQKRDAGLQREICVCMPNVHALESVCVCVCVCVCHVIKGLPRNSTRDKETISTGNVHRDDTLTKYIK